MYLILILIPLINFLMVFLRGEYLGKRGTIRITKISFSISILLSIFALYEVCFLNSICYLKIWNWVIIEEFKISLGFLFDTITIVMCFVIYTISSLVHLYSFEYMKDDPHFVRFISFLSLFTFFMIIVVTADNFVQLFFGWECVGLASYLLINFWYTRIQANKSALKAIIVNKIGDIGVIISIIIIYSITKSFDYVFVFNYIYLNDFSDSTTNWILVANIALLIGIMAKSAQIGLHTWLVDAMEGPTPVSALLHAATMVTVGVFCIIRCNILFEKTPIILTYVMIIGALTALFGSIVGLLQNDIKRIIAYSTCSQLGYMLLSCGSSYYEAALYHLANHAFFKALLFLTAGGVIHALNGKQDIREMGSLLKLNRILYTSFFIGSVALMGLPFLSGFYSKDHILEFILAKQSLETHFFCYVLGLIAAFFTAFYSTRLLYLTFISKYKNINKNNLLNLHKLSKLIYIPLILLSIFSIFFGWLSKDFFIGIGSDSFEGPIPIYHKPLFLLEVINIETIPVSWKLLPNILTLLSIILCIIYCKRHESFNYFVTFINSKKNFENTNIYFQKRLFFDKIYNSVLVNSTFFLSYDLFYKVVDRGLYEIVGPYGLTLKLYKIIKNGEEIINPKIYSKVILLYILSVIIVFNLFYFNLNLEFLYVAFLLFIVKSYI